MSSLVVRGLDYEVKRRLAARAAEHGRSMEAEVREILTRAASPPHIGVALLDLRRELGAVDEWAVPERSDPARAVDFG